MGSKKKWRWNGAEETCKEKLAKDYLKFIKNRKPQVQESLKPTQDKYKEMYI